MMPTTVPASTNYTSGRISCSGAVSIVSKTLAMHGCFCRSAIIATVKIPKTDVREACCTFLVPQRALQEQNFAACEFEIQFT